MKLRRVTSKQVAERAGVSQTTVSFVLNDAPNSNISEETRQRVFDAARELNYVPDMAARNLARGRSSTIALILIKPHEKVFADPYIPNVISGLNHVAKANNLRILVHQVETLTGTSQLDAVSDLLRSGEAAGAIISGWMPEVSEVAQPLLDDGYPLVLLDMPDAPIEDIPCVSIDHLSGVRLLAQYLIELGHRRIGCITYGPMSDLQVQKRLTVFRETLLDADVPIIPEFLRLGAYDPDSGYAAALSLLDMDEPPTAIYCMNDLMALGAIAAIHERGLRIPDDISVVGYDDMRFAPYTVPALTTMRAPESELGERAGELLISLMNKKTRKVKQQVLRSQLIIRNSCAVVR